MIKADGTLYPLIRGRVDRAIEFYKKQYEKTGKKAVFVPSGGKGSNEPMAEAEAMKRYLLEQGIPEEQIMAEDQSKNTLQNMIFSKRLIEEKNPNAKVAFSTTNFHVFRSGIIAIPTIANFQSIENSATNVVITVAILLTMLDKVPLITVLTPLISVFILVIISPCFSVVKNECGICCKWLYI